MAPLTDPVMLTTQNHLYVSAFGSVRLVAERGTRAGSSQAMG